MKVSIVIPAKNEAAALPLLLKDLNKLENIYEIIIVNDGSTDETSSICQSYGVLEVKHPYSKGNGAAVKAGARVASGDILVFMDADGQHKPSDVHRLLEKLETGYDMVVGARDAKSQASLGRLAANTLYNKLASWVVDQKIPDLTSGFRAVRAVKFRQFLYLLPNGFSYPTTSTMAFFRAGLSVGYMPITALKREGLSHINYLKDGVRFLLIIFKVASLYSPLKLFTPISMIFFLLGLIRYVYTYIDSSTFTNMSALLFVTSVLVFLIGIVSEQITVLMYQRAAGERQSDRLSAQEDKKEQ
ncbi:glycosyltransferase family 2 protein [Alkalimarinus coralli]|uniref:glycosyltransferase family 2 protein n=1 Tax=Alkalimarinus coralli TaxID=2935863 RepID=UPI00202B00A2|nr:glycosyltransferase family 2 protein [Alkalimarinus coralli]